MDILDLINKFGVQVGLLIFFIWRDWQTSKEYNGYIKDIASKAVAAISKSTEVDEKVLTVLGRVETVLDRERGV